MASDRFCPACGAVNKAESTLCFACGLDLAASAGNGEEKAQSQALVHERYQLRATLGSGGFSAVYRALDLRSGREVAIKQINLQGLSAEEAIEATNTFNREVSLLSTLRHPQVPRLYDHFNDRDHWYLVLEYLEGVTLESYLETRAAQGQPIQIDEALAIGLQLCSVLEYLHTHEPPVIFRDLKPGNIIRSPDSKLSLIDFGIARHFRPGQARDTQPLGSPGYAAPEQYGRAQTTPQADIYSLGALLHALLSGQDPADQPLSLAPLRLRDESGETELAALVQRMLSLAPEERPASVREVASALEAIKRRREAQNNDRLWRPPVPQEPPAWSGQQRLQFVPLPANARVSSKRRRNPLVVALLACLVVFGGGGLWAIHAQGSMIG